MLLYDEHAFTDETVPRHLRSLFVLRITLCFGAAGLALIKILLSPPLSQFFLDVFADYGSGLAAFMRALDLVISGLLAMFLALVIATYLIQARLQAHAEREAGAVAHLEESEA
jgi:hypothetical protein